MVTHDAALPPITEDTIRAIWAAHGLGAVTHISMPAGGVRNLCFFVNDTLVVRFNTQDRGSAKLHNECLAYRLLAGQALPVPKVILLDDSHTLTPYDFLITTRLPGQTLAQTWQRLSADQLHAVLFAAGQCLARLHSCRFPAFGKLHSLTYNSWASYVDNYVDRYLRAAQNMHLLGADLHARVQQALSYAMLDFAHVTQPALIHCDFHYENILHVKGHLAGVLDFEWALAGDPSYDFMIAGVRERMVPNSEAVFLAGYRSIRAFGVNHQRRVQWYELFLQLEEAVVFQRHGDHASALSAVERLRELTDAIEP